MSLLDVARSGVKIADKLTKAFQPSVSYERCTATADDGRKTYASAVSLRAIVELKQRNVVSQTGEVSVSASSVLFLDVAALKTATANVGITDDDRITLPDGSTGPILSYDGFMDAGTAKPLATQVYLG